MDIFMATLRRYRWHLAGVFMLTLLFSALGVAVLAFINNQLLQAEEAMVMVEDIPLVS